MSRRFACDCDDWAFSWPQIEAAQVLAHTHGSTYAGAIFKYCPWCGLSLKIEDLKEDDEKSSSN